MNISKTLTAERIAEIQKMPVIYDEDSPKLTPEQIKALKPMHPENFKAAKRK